MDSLVRPQEASEVLNKTWKVSVPRIHSCVFSLSWTCALLGQAVVLASPANPLGSVTHLEELQRIAKVVEEKVPALLGLCG